MGWHYRTKCAVSLVIGRSAYADGYGWSSSQVVKARLTKKIRYQDQKRADTVLDSNSSREKKMLPSPIECDVL